MRLMHLADLHLGKRVNEFSMIADQRYILDEIIKIADEKQPDGVLIAGDVYDRSAPAEDAVRLLDHFLSGLAERNIEVFMVNGNHDSPVRLSFASALIDRSGIHIAPVYDGTLQPYLMEKDGLRAAIYLLPFLRPSHVRMVFGEEAEQVTDYTTACELAIGHREPSDADVHILVGHQFVTGAVRSESEDLQVGGLDNVDVSVFEPFDYVALGHIHGAQHIGRESVRYSGTPLKYSFSEARQQKSVTFIELSKDQPAQIEQIPLVPMHDLRVLRGSFMELTDRSNYENTATDDYIYAVLTDEEDVPDAMAKLRVIYPNLMKLTYDNARMQLQQGLSDAAQLASRQPMELFSELYELQNNRQMSGEQTALVAALIAQIWEEH